MAVFAILLMALAPSLSHALRAQAAPGWIEVCTALGAKWVDAAAADTRGSPDSPPAQARVFDHCPYCSLHAADTGLPPASISLVVGPVLQQRPGLFLSAPHTLHAWLAAQPRGPPPLA